MSEERKYATDSLFYFPLITTGAVDFLAAPTPATNDVKLKTNNQFFTNTTAKILGFDSMSEIPSPGDTITEAVGDGSAVVMFTEIISGTIGGGTAAGFMFVKTVSGTWTNDQNIDITAGNSNVATVDSGTYDTAITAGLFGVLSNGAHALALTAAEMTCSQGQIHIVDAVGSVWEDQAIQFETFGNASALRAFDLDLAEQTVDAVKAGGQTITAAAGITINAELGASATAMNNFEDQYDATGLVGDTFPATQAQIGQLATGAGGISTISNSDTTITTGTETLTFAVTDELDGTTHDVAADAGNTDFYYEFDVGPSGVATEFVWEGYAQSNGDSYAVFAYDWVAAEFKQIGSITASNGSTVTEHVFIPQISMTGTGANVGLVRLQFTSADGTEIFTDRVLCEFTAAIGGIANGSTITLAADTISKNFIGKDWILALGGQNITNSFFSGATVSGTATATAKYEFEECDLGAVTMDNLGHFERCGFEGTFTVGQAGTFTFHQCYSQSTSNVTIDFAAVGATAMHLFDFHGELTIANMAAGDTLHITGAGTLTMNANCTGGTVDHDGFFEYTADADVTEQQSDIKVAIDAILVDTGTTLDGRIPAALVNGRMDSSIDATGFEQGAIDNIWDEPLTAMLHNDPTSAGRRLRMASEIVQVDSAVDNALADATTSVFKTDLTEPDDHWNDSLIVFTSGTLLGQSRPVLDFANTNGVVTVSEALTSIPVDNVTFTMISDHIHPVTQIADGVLDRDASSFTTNSTLGAIINDWENGGRLDLIQDIIAVDTTTDIPALIAALPTAAEVVNEWESQSQLDPTGFHVNVLEVAGTAQTAGDLAALIVTADAAIDALNDISVADVLTTQMTESYAADGAAPTLAQSLMLTQQMLGEFAISGTSLTVKKVDGSTTAAVFTLDDGTNPTSLTRAS